MSKYLGFILVFALMFSMICSSADAAAKKWTVFVFLNGDNNLSAAGNDDVNEMKKIGSNDQLNIVVLHDRSGSNDTRFLYIEKNKETVLESVEVNMGDWHKFVEYGKRVMDNYPAEHYFFTVWNHGAGIRNKVDQPIKRGISYDDSSGHSHITVPELGKALEELTAYNNGKKIDIYGSDACLMAMPEIAYELRNGCDYAIGSEETEPGDGWPYDDFLGPLAANTNMTPAELCKVHVNAYNKSYNGGSQGSSAVTQSATDESKISYYVETLINNLAKACMKNEGDYDNILSAMSATQKYAYAEMIDIYHFCQLLQAKVSSSEIKRAAQAIIDDRDNLNTVMADGNTGGKVANSHGLAIYFPTKSQYSTLKEKYNELAMTSNCKWNEFLSGLYFPKTPLIKFIDVAYADQNGETKVNPGDEVKFTVKVSNEGTDTASSVRLSLKTNDSSVYLANSSTFSFSVPGLGNVTNSDLKLRVNNDCEGNHTIIVKVVAEWDGKKAEKEISILVRKPFAVANKVLLIVKNVEDEFSKYYLGALAKAGIKFDVWDIAVESKITLSVLKQYVTGMVIYNAPGTSEISEINIADMQKYLEAGGNLFLTGQDVGYKLKSDSFYSNFLHAKFVQDNTGIHALRGSDLFSGINLSIAGGTGANNQKWPDEIDALSGAKVLFTYDNSASKINVCPDTEMVKEDQTKGVNASGCGALKYADSTYSVVYFAFGFEAISDDAKRTEVMKKVVADITPSFTGTLNRLVAMNEKRMVMLDSVGIDTDDNEAYVRMLDDVDNYSKVVAQQLIGEFKEQKFENIRAFIGYALENKDAREHLRPVIDSLKECVYNSRKKTDDGLDDLESL